MSARFYIWSNYYESITRNFDLYPRYDNRYHTFRPCNRRCRIHNGHVDDRWRIATKFTDEEIISSDSEVYGKTILDAALKAYDDIKNLDSVSLESLYKSYGIKLLNGIGDVDFTGKDFYAMPLKELFKDMSKITNSFTLEDIGTFAKLQLPDIPIIDDNLSVGINDAINNILGSIDGNLTIRDIQSKFGIDIGVGANKMIQAIQDVRLSAFGDTINAVRLFNLLDVDVDEFIKSGANTVYVKLGEDGIYEEVSKEDLAKRQNISCRSALKPISREASTPTKTVKPTTPSKENCVTS